MVLVLPFSVRRSAFGGVRGEQKCVGVSAFFNRARPRHRRSFSTRTSRTTTTTISLSQPLLIGNDQQSIEHEHDNEDDREGGDAS
jgi:hypothetical protein